MKTEKAPFEITMIRNGIIAYCDINILRASAEYNDTNKLPCFWQRI